MKSFVCNGDKIREVIKCLNVKQQQGDINTKAYDILMEWTGGDNLGQTISLFITEPPSVRRMDT